MQLPDGTVMVNLQDRFQEVAMATVGADGKPAVRCVHDAATAEAILKGDHAASAASAGPDGVTDAARKEAAKKAETKRTPVKAEEE